MTTKYFYISGPCLWAKLKTPDTFQDQERYKITIELDKNAKKVLKDSGVQLKTQEIDGKDYVTLRRPVSAVIKGETIEFGPPKLLDKEHEDLDVLVGNGSLVTAKFSVYETRKGKGHRLEAVRVDELIEYTPLDDQPF